MMREDFDRKPSPCSDSAKLFLIFGLCGLPPGVSSGVLLRRTRFKQKDSVHVDEA